MAAKVHRSSTASWAPKWRDRFQSFDDDPRLASIGQVQVGVALTGREVAVKIQYPG